MSLCPPPRVPSPQLVPSPLPSPPPMPRRISSRSRLHLPANPNEPPIPPRLVGSPLLDRLALPDPAALTPKIQKQLWFDGDEFGTRAAGAHHDAPSLEPSSASSSSSSSAGPSTPSSPRTPRRTHRRSPSVAIPIAAPFPSPQHQRARSRSPPPPRTLAASIPPVPPIPSSAFDSPGAKRAVVRTSPQIVIPDLGCTSSESAGRRRRVSRSYPGAGGARRRSIVGCEAH